jgi:photosystem II stability/assembly factor-like uncharacterized protein
MRRFLGCLLGLTLGLAPRVSVVLPAESTYREPAFLENFYGVKIRGPHAWIVGYYGTVLHSADRGASWEIQRSGTKEALFQLDFTSDEEAWITGSYGTILHTQDGGRNWAPQPSGTQEHLFSLALTTSREGWVVGSRGTILHTSDGGSSWLNRSIAEDIILNRTFFISQKQGWIVGEFGVIYQTRDGGKKWIKQKSPIEVSFVSGESRNLFGLIFPDSKGGWAFGLDGVILKTQTGDQWGVINPNGSRAGRATTRHLFAAAHGDGKLWAVGERGTVIISQIGKENWRPSEFKFPPISLNGIDFSPDGFGLVVGNRGAIFRTLNGGRQWQRIRIAPAAPGKGIAQVQ